MLRNHKDLEEIVQTEIEEAIWNIEGKEYSQMSGNWILKSLGIDGSQFF